MSKKNNTKEIMKFAGTYISVCIGSGFATGQEIMQFFSAHGIGKSVFSVLVCMIILSYCGAKLLEIGKSANLRSSNDIFNYLWGESIGGIFKLFMPVFFLCSFVVMVSGAGASINQYYGLSKGNNGYLITYISFIRNEQSSRYIR